MKTRKDINTYLFAQSPEKRAVLQQLREDIHALLPGATEGFSYGMPAIIVDEPMIAFAALKNACSIYPMSGSILEQMEDDLKGYTYTKGALQFPADKPFPMKLLKKMVKLKVQQVKEKNELKKVKRVKKK